MEQLAWIIFVIGAIVFGVIAQMMLLNMQISSMTRGKQAVFLTGFFMVLAVNFASVLALGMEQHVKYYILFVHLPMTFLFWAVTKIHPIKIIFTLFTAVFLTFPANLLSNLYARYMTERFKYISILLFLSILALTLFLINKFLKKDFHYLINHYSNQNFTKLFFLPLIYNVAIFWVGRYNYSIETPINNLITRIFLFLLALTAYLLILDISRTDREKHDMKHEQAILSLQLESANKQMTFLHEAHEQTIIYRHDMRHHLALLSAFANDDDLKKIKEYLSRAEGDIDTITPVRYCENETVNLILSSFESIAKKKGIVLCTEITLPQELGLSDTELCSLLSNSLENGITAAAQVENEKLHKVYIRALVSGGKLIISTENAYVGKLHMDGELPKSQNDDASHGFGIKSMIAIVERHGGLYSFETANGVFILQLMLPIKEIV